MRLEEGIERRDKHSNENYHWCHSDLGEYQGEATLTASCLPYRFQLQEQRAQARAGNAHAQIITWHDELETKG